MYLIPLLFLRSPLCFPFSSLPFSVLVLTLFVFRSFRFRRVAHVVSCLPKRTPRFEFPVRRCCMSRLRVRASAAPCLPCRLVLFVRGVFIHFRGFCSFPIHSPSPSCTSVVVQSLTRRVPRSRVVGGTFARVRRCWDALGRARGVADAWGRDLAGSGGCNRRPE